MAIRRRSNGHYEIDYYVGSRRVREVVGPNRKEAEQALAQRLQDIRAGRFNIARLQQTTLYTLINRYKEAYRHQRGWRVKAYFLDAIARFFPLTKLVSSFTRGDVEAYMGHRMKAVRQRGELPKNSTVNQEVQQLRHLLKKAVDWGYLGLSPAAGVQALKLDRPRARFLTREEAHALLAETSGYLRPIVICALNTGMRKGEILDLQWGDVDLELSVIHVRNGKTGSRFVPISQELGEVLQALPRRGPYVFTGKIKLRDVKRTFGTACRRAGIKDFRFHDLRHTAASHLTMAGVPARTVQEILGHSSPQMTARYSHLLPQHKVQAVNTLKFLEANNAK